MSTGTLWASCSNSASSLSSLPKPKPPPPPQGNRPHFPLLTGRPDYTSGLSSYLRVPHTIISNGAGRFFLPASLLRSGRPAQREISPHLHSAPHASSGQASKKDPHPHAMSFFDSGLIIGVR